MEILVERTTDGFCSASIMTHTETILVYFLLLSLFLSTHSFSLQHPWTLSDIRDEIGLELEHSCQIGRKHMLDYVVHSAFVLRIHMAIYGQAVQHIIDSPSGKQRVINPANERLVWYAASCNSMQDGGCLHVSLIA